MKYKYPETSDYILTVENTELNDEGFFTNILLQKKFQKFEEAIFYCLQYTLKWNDENNEKSCQFYVRIDNKGWNIFRGNYFPDEGLSYTFEKQKSNRHIFEGDEYTVFQIE